MTAKKQTAAPRIAAKTTGKSLDDFRAAHDKSFIIPVRLKAALQKLGDGWEYEAEFLRIAGVGQVDIGRYREQFRLHIIETRGKNAKRVWCGSEKVADAMREMVE